MRFFDWLDDRIGYRKLLRAALYEHVPGGARWRYVWGSTLTFAIVVQFITGVILWMYYSASAQTAWESVYYINEVVPGGWILRGIHHYMAQLMVPLLILHLMQVIIDGAYKAPREFNYWFGLGLLVLTLAISLTGYLLPWDQKGYWSTKVVTNLVSNVPVVGEGLQRVAVGDAEYGSHTLTRFFALHAGILPGALVLLIIIHIALFRKHGLTPAKPIRKPDAMFWPDQVLRDAIACIAVMGAVLGLVFYFRGADLGAPANPAENFDAARPDWYFMFLFQFLKYPAFQGSNSFLGIPGLTWGSIIIPGLVFLFLMLIPLIGRWQIGRFRAGHWLNVIAIFLGLSVFAALTKIAFTHDMESPVYQNAMARMKEDSARVKQLAKERGGIPVEGALALVKNDAPFQAPRIFAKSCAKCHRYNGHDGLGGAGDGLPATAPDLAGFGSRKWLTEFMDPTWIETHKYFGGTAFVNPKAGEKKSKMVRFILDDVAGYGDEEKKQLEKIIAAISAEARLPAQKEMDAKDATMIAEGKKLLADVALDCTDCHAFHEIQGGTGPDFTGYGSAEWLTEFIKNPAHDRFYGKKNDRMPAYGDEKELSKEQLEMLVRWLRGE